MYIMLNRRLDFYRFEAVIASFSQIAGSYVAGLSSPPTQEFIRMIEQISQFIGVDIAPGFVGG